MALQQSVGRPITRSPFAWIGAPNAGLDLAAWTAYFKGLRDNLAANWSDARNAYVALKKVREDNGLPFIDDTPAQGEQGSAASMGAWTTDLDAQAQDIQAMVVFTLGVLDDVVAGKRRAQFTQSVGDWQFEALPSDLLRVTQQSPSGAPQLIDASTGQPTHVTGQISAPALVWVAEFTVSALALPAYWAVDLATKSLTDVAEQKTMLTIAQRSYDCVTSGKCTPDQAAKINSSVYTGAAALRNAKANEAAAANKPSSDWADTVKVLGWVALGLGGIYLLAKVIPSGGLSRGSGGRKALPAGGGMKALPAHLAENPRRRRTRLDELRDMLPANYSVYTWSPGDGQTRYRFFENAPPNQTYFGPDNGVFTALGYKEAYTFAEGLRRDNPSYREPADEQAAQELELYLDNDARFSPGGSGQGRAISKSLWKKWKKGTYSEARAPQAWSYVVESAAKAYAKEFAEARDWSRIFTPATRALVAENLARNWEGQARSGELDRYPP